MSAPGQKWQYHVSGLIGMAQCGERWRLENIDGIRHPTRAVLATGTGAHAAIAANLAYKIERGSLLELEECEAVAADNTAAELDKGFDLDLDEREKFGEGAEARSIVRGGAIDRAVMLARTHHLLVAPKLSPTHVERDFVINVKGYDFQITGKMDVREVRRTGSVHIRDTKTARKAPRPSAAHDSTQLTVYALAEYVVEGQAPAAVALDFLVDYKRKPNSGPGKAAWERAESALGHKPEAVPMVQASTRTMADFSPALERFQILEQARQKGVYFPADPSVPGAWWCSEKFCPHWHGCKFARRPVTVAVPELAQIGEAA